MEKKGSDESSGMVILAGNSHPYLCELICHRLGIRIGDAIVYNKSNTETSVDIKQSVRGKHVFIIQSGTNEVNNNIMELLIMIYACRTSSCKTVTVVMPYLPYSKQCRMLRRGAIAMKLQCRMLRRGAIAMKLVADMICKAGASRLISLDLYKKEIQGFFSIPVDNLRASPFLLQYIRDEIPDYRNAVIVAKSPGVMHKATSYADRLRLNIAVIHGEEGKESEETLKADGRQSPPRGEDAETANNPAPNQLQSPISERKSSAVASYELYPVLTAKEKPPLTVVGDVGGKIAIIVDDIIDDASSFIAAAEVLKKKGAYKIYVIATHGVMSGGAPIQLEESCIDQIVVTNTIPHELQKMRCHKIKTVDISIILCEAIRRTYHKESMAFLFKDIALED
uniref:Ribose-phosphate pyrophosphokinase N-terminal domain-containing protein n=1 Tax=Panagrolaimus sp. JU765 TaxID=591449 RepID=A0AC34QYC5_9BILA